MCVAARKSLSRSGTVGIVELALSGRPTPREFPMTQEFKGVPLKPGPIPKPQAKDPDKPKERSEAAEIAGRHKNSGQKDRKGAR